MRSNAFREVCTCLALLSLLSACGGEIPGTVEMTSDDPGPIGFFTGTFPCDGCPGITAEVLLHEDGYFFSRQEYLSGSAGTLSTASAMGRWAWFADDDLLVLQARGPERRFSMPETGVLEMIAQTGGDHRVYKSVRPDDFPGSLSLIGMLERRGDMTFFSECATDLETPVETGAEYQLYIRQLRRAGNPQGPVYAELDGEYGWSAEGSPASLAIRRFGTIRPDRRCQE